MNYCAGREDLQFRINSSLLMEPTGGTGLGLGASYTIIGASLSIHPSPFTITSCSPITIYNSLSQFTITIHHSPIPLHPYFAFLYVVNGGVCRCL